MKLTMESRGAITVISISGRVDAMTAMELEEALMASYGNGNRKFLLDCPNLTYISSAGLRILLKVYKQIKPMNGVIALSTLQPHIADIFNLTGFNRILPIHDTLASGLGAMTKPPQ